jgi:SAM-dependent methyltransferase
LAHLDDDISTITRLEETRRLNKRVAMVTDYKQGGRLLDVGCSTGRFLNQMRLYGDWTLYGIELSVEAVQEAHNHYNLPIIAGLFQDTAFQSSSFDVVTLWDVVEHLHNPLNDLQRVSHILKPNGIVVFSIPILDSLGAKIFKENWIGYELPRHLYIFSRQTITQVLQKAGLEIIDEQALYGSDYAFADSVRFLLRSRGLPRGVYGPIFAMMCFWPYRWAFSPIFKTLDWFKLTSLATIVARKV